MQRYTREEAEIISAARKAAPGRRIQSFERAASNADAGGNPNAVVLAAGPGNPPFSDTFTVNVITKYFTESSGTYTNRTAAYVLANAAVLATYIAAFIFGYSDSQTGYAYAKNQLPLGNGTNNWAYGDPFVYGMANVAYSHFSALDATAKAFLQPGDYVITFWSTITGPVNYVALVILRMSNAFYANLLVGALASDTFESNKLRYNISDTTTIAQFSNPIKLLNMSLFGATAGDFIDPLQFKDPDQFQAGIIDIPFGQTIYKAVGWGTYVNYDCVLFSFNVYVRRTTRLR